MSWMEAKLWSAQVLVKITFLNLDYHPVIDGVDYRKSIFIFLSNTGGRSILDLCRYKNDPVQ